MAVNIHATEKALFRVFCNDYAFEIPPYQRPYAWTTEQAGELLFDILAFMDESSAPVTEINPYFLGSIVLIKNENSPRADIVDGQQRLTTLTILLAVLRSLLPDQYANELTTFIYEKGILTLGTQNRYRLKLRERDETFFRNHIQNEDGLSKLFELNSGQLNDSQRNIRNNAIYFIEKLKDIPEDGRVRLLQYLMQRCFLVVVSTPDLDSAYRIFSVLNARGLDLGLTDLLKSEIIGALPTELQEKYTNIWEDEEEDLGRDAFQELFAHIRMIYRKSKLKETALSEYRKYIKPHEFPKKFIDDTLKPLSDSLEILKKECYACDKNASSINILFHWLNQIDNFDWIPPALLLLTKHYSSPDLLLQFFTDLERLAAGLMILRADVNERINRYSKLQEAIELGEDLYASSSPLQLTEQEKSDIKAVLNGDIYNIQRIRLYVLLRLDSVLSQGEVTYNYPFLSIEHVLPQNPAIGSKWLQWFPDEESRAKYTHKIGNLVLLSRRKNAQAQNYDFDKKKSSYFTTEQGISPFALTTQVLKQTEWTPDIIEARQVELTNKLKELWRL